MRCVGGATPVSVLWCGGMGVCCVVLCCVVLCCVVLCCVVLCCVVLCCVVLCCAVLCCVVLCCVVFPAPDVWPNDCRGMFVQVRCFGCFCPPKTRGGDTVLFDCRLVRHVSVRRVLLHLHARVGVRPIFAMMVLMI